MTPPMPTTPPNAAPRRSALREAVLCLVVSSVVLAACANEPSRSGEPSLDPSATPAPTATPIPTPVPTPFFSNVPDPELVALIPTTVAGATVVIPAITDFSITPGDIGEVYGEVGLGFRSLQLAYVSRPRLSLFAIRMQPPVATNADLEPYLAEVGRYVGIAGLHREPWELKPVADHMVWVRPEDDATLPGTRVYTWAVGGYLFLVIGIDEAQNLAMLAALPGEPAPTPTPLPSGSASIEPSASP